MPLMGGDIGCNVWVEDGDILLYVQRSGSLSENGEYLNLGRFRLRLDPNPFTAGSLFRQELKLQDGYVEISSEKTDSPGSFDSQIRLWVDVFRPVVQMEFETGVRTELSVFYESWRTEDKELRPITEGRERFAAFNLEGYPGKVIRVKDIIQQDEKGILFYHQNPQEKLIPEVLIAQQGLEASADTIVDDLKDRIFGGILTGPGLVAAGQGEGVYQITPYKSWKMRSEKPGKIHKVILATHIKQGSLEDWMAQLDKTAAFSLSDKGENFKTTKDWWHKFWDRSHIFIFPDNPDPADTVWQMSRNYQLFRYQLGGNIFGEYPTKFNGGNLVYDPVLINERAAWEPDWRQWGGSVFTAQNQRLLYWPMLKAGDFDVILPQFELYRKGLPGATARVATHFGHPGAVYSEYTSVPGIAMGDGWGWKNDFNYRIRGPEIPFGDPRATAATSWHDPVEKGVMANGAIAYHWESQVEHAYMILEYHRFTGADISKYMPFIERSLIFFDEHYRARQRMRNGQDLDENGKLVIFPSTSCESYRGAKNPSDLIAGLKACAESMLTLDDKWVNPERKAYYREYLTRIPELSYGEVNGDSIVMPAESWMRYQNVECPQFYPLFPFNRFNLAEDDMTIFRNTWKHGTFPKNMVQSWHQDGIFFARMGMTEDAASYNTRKLKDSERRFPTFWGPGHDWVPDHNHGGSGMIGLQEMLLQTIGNQIHILPAWPLEWDVDFKLHAPGNTIVECCLKDGQIVRLQVTPESRKKDIICELAFP